MNYDNERNLDKLEKNILSSMFNGMLDNLKATSQDKVTAIIKDIPAICRKHYESHEYSKAKNLNNNMHPLVVNKGEIYFANITEGVGKELCGNHLVIVIQTWASSLYSDKVTVVPIEGDGLEIKKSYQLKLTNNDLEQGTISKDPSRIIFSDIMTWDKSRLMGKIGKLNNNKIIELENKIRKNLGL